MPPTFVLVTEYGWMIKCKACGHHYIPIVGKPGASWTFNGDVHCPTFNPSVNELVNSSSSPHFNPDAHLKDYRCHYIVSNGNISYCGDCTHDLAGQTLPMIPFPEVEVKMNAMSRNA